VNLDPIDGDYHIKRRHSFIGDQSSIWFELKAHLAVIER